MATVFISYRHVNLRHKERVREFAHRLQDAGVEVVLDQFLPQAPDPSDPYGGWDRWSEDQVSFVEDGARPAGAASKIIVVASREWIAAYNKDAAEDAGKGLGSACEAVGIRRILYRCKGSLERAPVRVVTLGPWGTGQFPPLLGELLRYDLDDPAELAALVQWLDATLPPLPPMVPWPAQPPPLEPWQLALGGEARAACSGMLITGAHQRVLRLLLSGKPDERRIGWMLFQCASNLQGRAGAAINVGRLDLKGGTSLGLDLKEFAQSLGCNELILEHLDKSELDLLCLIFDRLERLQVPTLLIFDSIEQGGSFQDWVARIALPRVPKVEWLRIVTAGEKVPEPEGAQWGDYAGQPLFVGGAKAEETANSVLQRVDTAFVGKPPADRIALRSAFIAAAVPHWCDPGFLAALLNENLRPRAPELFAALRELPDVEAFLARGQDAVNVAARPRAALRRHLVQSEPDLLRLLSGRAATFLAGVETRTVRMERVYHRLVAEGSAAAGDAEALDSEFWQGSGAAEHSIYAAMLLELANEGSIRGRALVEALLSAGFSASKLARLEEARSLALRAREAAQAGIDIAMDEQTRALLLWGMARTYCIEGEIAAERLEAPEAKRAYEKYLALMQEVTSASPDHLRLRREEAVAESRVGNCNEPEAALPHYHRARALQATIVAAKPDDLAEQRELSMLERVEGEALLKQGGKEGTLDAALRLLVSFVTSARDRVARDSANLLWLADLAEGLRQLGDAQQMAGQSEAALKTFREGLETAQRWVSLDPLSSSGAGWVSLVHDPNAILQVAEGRLINALLPSAEFGEAQALCQTHLARCQAAAEAVPGNLEAQFRLGVAHYYLGELRRCQGAPSAALPCYLEAEKIYNGLVTKNANLGWRREQANVLGCIGSCQNDLGLRDAAKKTYAAQVAVCGKLEADAPGHYNTQRQTVWAHLYLGGMAAADSLCSEAKQHYDFALTLARGLAVDQQNADAQRTLAQTLLCAAGFWLMNEEREDVYVLAATSEACRIYRSLADQAPSDVGRLAELAGAHLQLASILESHQKIEQAAQHRKTAAGLFEQQMATLGNSGLETFSAICLAEQSAILAAQDREVARPVAIERALSLFRKLAADTERFCENPDNQNLEGPRKKLLGFYDAIGTLSFQKRAFDAAAAAYRQALAGWEDFQARHPERTEWLQNAANVHARLADVAAEMLDFAEAERQFSAAITGLEECWRRAPSNPFWRRSLVVARYRRASLLARSNREAEALDDLEKCREHLEHIEQLPDQGHVIKRNLVELEQLTGDVLSQMARYEEAIAAYSGALDRAEKLAVITVPPDEAIRGHISALEHRLGVACRLADRLGEAEVFLKRRQAFCEEHLARGSEEPFWSRELAVACSQLGSLRWQLSEVAESLELHRQAMRLLEAATVPHPENKGWLSDLAYEYNMVGVLLQRQFDLAGAIHHGQRAVAIMEQLVADAPLVVWTQSLESYRTNLSIYLQSS